MGVQLTLPSGLFPAEIQVSSDQFPAETQISSDRSPVAIPTSLGQFPADALTYFPESQIGRKNSFLPNRGECNGNSVPRFAFSLTTFLAKTEASFGCPGMSSAE